MNTLLFNYFYKYISLLPIVLFLWMGRFGYSWIESFFAGGALALGYVIYSMIQRKKIDYLILSLYLFLIGGACMIFKIPGLIYFYKTLKQPIIFVWLTIVGLFTTVLSSSGFIDVQNISRNKVIKGSLLLLGVTVGLFFFALYVKELSTFLATSGACIIFVFVRNMIQNKIGNV